MAHVYQSKFRTVRIYDGGTTGDSQNVLADSRYIVGVDVGSLPLPLGRQRPDQVLNLSNGILDANSCIVNGPDDPILTPISVSFTFRFNSRLKDHLKAWANPSRNTPWQIGPDTWTPVTVIGSDINGLGATVALPPPTDIVRAQNLVDLYVEWGASPGVAGSVLTIQQGRGFSVNADETTIDSNAEFVEVSGTGLLYGELGADKVAAFPGGTETVIP